jgi:RHS repeat-associated protein
MLKFCTFTKILENPFRFPGQYYDPETGLHYNYFRYYNPQTGRYITPDPIGLKGGMNLLVYIWNNPINQTDPFGLEAWIKCLRCGKKGPLFCRIIEDGIETGWLTTNWDVTNYPSITPGDPYGEEGPLPPIVYQVLNAFSPEFGRILPSPTNTGNPGEVRTPNRTLRKGIRFHANSRPPRGYSLGCPTLGSGSSGRRLEDLITDMVNRHRGHGGTSFTIEEVDCCY